MRVPKAINSARDREVETCTGGGGSKKGASISDLEIGDGIASRTRMHKMVREKSHRKVERLKATITDEAKLRYRVIECDTRSESRGTERDSGLHPGGSFPK